MKRIILTLIPLVFVVSCTSTENITYPSISKKIIIPQPGRYVNNVIVIDYDADYSKILNLKELMPKINKYRYKGKFKIADTTVMTLNVDFGKGEASCLQIDNLVDSANIYLRFNSIGAYKTINKNIDFMLIKDNGKKINIVKTEDIILDNTKFIILEEPTIIDGVRYTKYYLKPIFLTEKAYKEKVGEGKLDE